MTLAGTFAHAPTQVDRKHSLPQTLFVIRRIFEKIRQYFGAQSESIPMSFVLGFYVSLVVKRWWDQYKLLPWPDTLALFISAAIPGNVSITLFILHWQIQNKSSRPRGDISPPRTSHGRQ